MKDMRHLDDANAMYNSGSTQEHGRPHPEDSRRAGVPAVGREHHNFGDDVMGALGNFASKAMQFMPEIPEMLNHGGKAHKAQHPEKHSFGDFIGSALGPLGGIVKDILPFKKGGHVESQAKFDAKEQRRQLTMHKHGGACRKATGGQIHNNEEGSKPYMHDGQMDGQAKRTQNPASIANGIPGKKPLPFKSGCKVKRK